MQIREKKSKIRNWKIIIKTGYEDALQRAPLALDVEPVVDNLLGDTKFGLPVFDSVDEVRSPVDEKIDDIFMNCLIWSEDLRKITKRSQS